MHKKKILIVDDEPDALFMLKQELEGRGYSVISAGSGSDAINLAKSEYPNLIILDILMPGADGLEVAAMLEEDPETKDIPIIYLSCLPQKKDEAEQGYVVGGKVLIAKPYSIERLSTQIKKLLQVDH